MGRKGRTWISNGGAMSKRGQVKPSVDAGGPDGDYTTKVSWRIESGKRIIEKVERIAPTHHGRRDASAHDRVCYLS